MSGRRPEWLISACLCGQRVRYDGGGFDGYPEFRRLVEEGRAVAVCPEMQGGLPVPRCPAECQCDCNGARRVVTREGTEVTAAYEEGARHALDVCRAFGIRQAILKARSPSCGVHAIYDGSFSGRLIPGEGVTARLLRQSGVRVLDEDDWCTLKKRRDEQDGRD